MIEIRDAERAMLDGTTIAQLATRAAPPDWVI
jgi:hypothetical protein